MAGWAATGHGCVPYTKGDTICPLWSRRLLLHQLGPSAQDRAGDRFPHATLEALSPELSRIPYADRSPLQPLGPDGFAAVHEQVRDAVAAQPSLPVWDVIDRVSAERRLAPDADSLNRREQSGIWRLATAFMALHP